MSGSNPFNRPGFNLPGLHIPNLPEPGGKLPPETAGVTAESEPIALVLSGGAAAGSFEVGALDYLYKHVFPKIGAPTIITGTSVGALHAAKLAEGGPKSPGGALKAQQTALSELKNIWLTQMTGPDKMYKPSSDLNTADNHLESLRKWLAKRNIYIDLPESALGLLNYDPLIPSWQEMVRNLIGRRVDWLAKLLDDLTHPFTTAIKEHIKSDILNLLLGLLKDGHSLFTLQPLEEKIRTDTVAASGIKLRVSMVGLLSGELHYMNESGQILDRDGKAIGNGDLHLGVRASATEPIIFKSVPIGNEQYVDGGVREILPAEMALRTGAKRVFAIHATARSGRESPFIKDPTAIANVGERLIPLFLDEIEFSDMRVAAVQLQDKLHYIEPTIDAHGGMEIDPSLIRIGIANGYMQAADTLQQLPSTVPSAGEITFVRLECYRMEKNAPPKVSGKPDPKNSKSQGVTLQPYLDFVKKIRKLKTDLKNKVERRLKQAGPDSLPDGASTWWEHWETKPGSNEQGPWTTSSPLKP